MSCCTDNQIAQAESCSRERCRCRCNKDGRCQLATGHGCKTYSCVREGRVCCRVSVCACRPDVANPSCRGCCKLTVNCGTSRGAQKKCCKVEVCCMDAELTEGAEGAAVTDPCCNINVTCCPDGK